MFTCRKVIRVEYAHQLYSSYTPACQETIHGHSGIIELFFSSDILNKDNMVIDFGRISDKIKPVLMDRFDHALFIPSQCPDEYLGILDKYNKKLRITPENPTAEYFSNDIYIIVSDLLREMKIENNIVRLDKVIFHETDTGYAEYRP